jgi:pyridoxamine 5'-phosphate oxidase
MLDSRATFDQRLAKAESDFDGREVPRPPRWSGLRVKPERIEFWFGAEFRIHERWLYERNRAGGWTKLMLYP